ncbi:hypothetical protein GCM10008024_11880 [Allgaiera indica]|nr:hypothetical protein GCM10008024_11880 [Allgaiera indica]
MLVMSTMSKKNILLATAAVSAMALSGVSVAQAETVNITQHADGSTTSRTVNNDGSVTTTTTTRAMVVSPSVIMAGPGTTYTQIESVPSNADLALQGCLASNDWCEVSYGGKTGWVSAQNIQVVSDGQAYAVGQAPSKVQIETLHYNKKRVRNDAAAGAMAGAVTGAAVGGPVGAAVGGLVGAATGAIATGPDKTVTTYITEHPVPAAQISGTIREGVEIPSGVALTPVPQSNYAYFYADGRPVVVNPQTRTVVRVIH